MALLAAIAESVGVLLLVASVLVAAWCVLWILVDEYAEWDARRKARIEVELDVKAEQLRETTLSLADELAGDRDKASKALTRAMYLTAGRTDHNRS